MIEDQLMNAMLFSSRGKGDVQVRNVKGNTRYKRSLRHKCRDFCPRNSLSKRNFVHTSMVERTDEARQKKKINGKAAERSRFRERTRLFRRSNARATHPEQLTSVLDRMRFFGRAPFF